MIIDTLDNSDKYILLHKDFKFVFDFLKNNDLSGMECGRYELRGNEIYFNLQEYETQFVQKLEAHKKYIDIQIVVKGGEFTGYTNINNTTKIEEYSEEKDVVFLNGGTDKFWISNKNFVIFFPQDAHMPALALYEPKLVKKAVFKIAI